MSGDPNDDAPIGAAVANAMADDAATADEYPAERWPFIYGGVLGVLALDLTIFFLLTRYYA